MKSLRSLQDVRGAGFGAAGVGATAGCRRERRDHGGGGARPLWLQPVHQIAGLGAGSREPGRRAWGRPGPVTVEKKQTFKANLELNKYWKDGWMGGQMHGWTDSGFGRRDRESRMTPRITHIN